MTHNVDVASLDEHKLITLEQIRMAAENDATYQDLVEAITTGFPQSKSTVKENPREYWEVRDRLSTSN